MTTIEDRLHELRHTVGLPAMPGADEVRQRATRRRRGTAAAGWSPSARWRWRWRCWCPRW
jgi:hypothetical protein